MRAPIVPALIALAASTAYAADPVTQAVLLERMIGLERLAAPPPAGETSGLFSSVGRGGTDGGVVGFLSRTEDGWDVMADMPGPGAIVRLWSLDPRGQIRVELDGETVIDVPFAEFFRGGAAPIGEPFTYQTGVGGGWNCYFPIGYDRHCRVLVRECPSHYQVDYVTFAPGTPVTPFKPELDEATQAVLKDVAKVLKTGFREGQLLVKDSKPMSFAIQDDVAPGKKLTDSIEKAGTIRALYIAPTDTKGARERYAFGQCVLRIWFDGEKEPSVEAPLADFFGSGFDRTPYQSAPVGTFAQPLTLAEGLWFAFCYFPMPYRNGARIEVENLTGKKIGLMIYARIDRREPPPDALRFNARFRAERPLKSADYTLLEVTGRGRLVGCTINVDCPRRDWWGGGDHRIWIDGASAPALHGAGTADLLGDAPPLRAFMRPFHGVTLTGPYGKNSGYRWFIGDCVNFRQSLRAVLGNEQRGGALDVDYSSVVYWYADPQARAAGFASLTADALKVAGFRLPGTVELEGAIAGDGWGNVLKQKNAGGGVELSAEAAVSISAVDRPLRVSLAAAHDGEFVLKLRAHPKRSFGTVEVKDGEGRLIGTVQYSKDAENGIYTIGKARLRAGDNSVTITCSRATVLDCWILEPVGS